MGHQAALIYNPASGSGKPKEKQLPHLLERLHALGIDARPAPTDSPGHATELAREALRQDASLVIGWGGDGTINEIAAGMLGSKTPLGVLPGGTVNVFARATGIPRGSLEKACRVLREGQPRAVPVGMAGKRPFLLMAGVGIDGEVVHRLDPEFKKRFGKSAFWLLGFRLLASYPFASLTVRVDGKEIQGTGLVAGKVRIYGPGYVITPPKPASRSPYSTSSCSRGAGRLIIFVISSASREGFTCDSKMWCASRLPAWRWRARTDSAFNWTASRPVGCRPIWRSGPTPSLSSFLDSFYLSPLVQGL